MKGKEPVMSNIFNAIDSISDIDLCAQIAIMRCVSVGNAMSEQGQKAIGMLTSWANALFNTSQDKSGDLIDYKAVTVEDKAKSQIEELKQLSHVELVDEFKKEIVSNINDLDSAFNPKSVDTDSLSVWIIREAGKAFIIGDNISPGNIAVLVKAQYEEKMLQRLHKNLANENPEQRTVTDKNIQQVLNKAPIEVMRELASILVPKEFSGVGFGKVLRAEKGIDKLKAFVDRLGFEAFDELKIRIDTMYDLVLTFNRLPRIFLADLIYVALKNYKKKFTYPTDLLPSFVRGKGTIGIDEEEKQYLIKIAERKNYQKRLDAHVSEIAEKEELLSKLSMEYLNALEEKRIADEEFGQLEAVKDEYNSDSVKTRDEMKKYFADVTKAGRRRDLANSSLESIEENQEKLTTEINEKKLLLNSMNEEFKNIRDNTDAQLIKRSQELALRWKAFFYRFRFDDVIFTTMVMEFSRTDMIKIEEFLKEMHDSRNPDGFSTFNEEEIVDTVKVTYSGIRCLVGQGSNAKIIYNNTYIRRIWKE